ncbi:MAG: type II toxin-antitoxin system HicB family antitoxin [Herpetosiphonaceae bacterium]|nr:type II toxin-antitoxin system HicB family antitoxin [Herpetosiphonaceae bacterium]
MTRTFTAVFEQRGDWWIGWTEELPGANVQERTLEEARQSLQEVIPLILEVRRENDEVEPTVHRVREELTVTV